jgi:hypothetical protein
MDKNLVAFLDPTAYTIEVKFARSGKHYMYVANASHGALDAGDLVIVPVGAVDTASHMRDLSAMVHGALEQDPRAFMAPEFKVVEVVAVHDTVSISPDSDTEYKWIVGRMDLRPWYALMQRNEQLRTMAEDAYKRNLRKAFAERVLGELDSTTAGKMQALLAPNKEK